MHDVTSDDERQNETFAFRLQLLYSRVKMFVFAVNSR